MRAIGVSQYGPPDNLQSKEIPRPPAPTGRQMRVEIKAVSVNPIDIKVRAGTYDDPPDYYDRVRGLTEGANEAQKLHVMGYDGAGVVRELGPDVRHFKTGDEIYFLGSPVLQGTYAEELLVDERHAGHKPGSLDFVQAAAMPLTYATAYESLVDRLGIRPNEKAGILVINGGGGMGSVASQIARRVLNLPVVITTASRPETEAFSRDVGGATHVVNHREDIVRQIRDLDLPADVPLKYAYITSRTEQYIAPIADVLAPFGRVCSIVQAKFDMYGTQFMSKSLSFAWCWLATGAYHGYVNDHEEKHHEWYEELASLLDDGTIKCHLTQRKRLTLENIREAHKATEAGKGVGKTALGVDEPGEQPAFC
ncbi:quinone oxidoreductase [Apiospora rasikravindrae]|uniref:Quinone oxidoreductase n=1 Tax=Apiospora rasikravindrae TaxID=990691 RepID=A0ABR1RVT6_9PEZI